MSLKAPLFPADVEYLEFPDQVQQAAHTGDGLRDHCGKGCSSHAQIEIDNKHQIQTDIDDGGEHQEIHRRLAVPQCPDHPRCDVIQEGRRNSQKNDPDIVVGAFDDIFRCLHQLQNLPAKRGGKQCQTGRQGDT